MASRIHTLLQHIAAAPTAADVAVAEAVDLTTTVHNMVINGKLVKVISRLLQAYIYIFDPFASVSVYNLHSRAKMLIFNTNMLFHDPAG